MLIREAAERVIRVRVRTAKGAVWDYGTAFWATNNQETKLLTAAHVFKKLGYPRQCKVDLWSTAYAPVVDADAQVVYSNNDPIVEFARIIVDGLPPPADPFGIGAHADNHCIGIGFPASLNKNAAGTLGDPHVGAVRGFFHDVNPIAGARASWTALRVQAIAEPGYSGGPLFSMAATSGGVAQVVKDVDPLMIKPVARGVCWGEHRHFRNNTLYANIDLFSTV